MDKLHAVLFQSYLLAIATKRIPVISIAFVYLKSKKDSSYKSNQSYRKYPVYS